MRPISIIMTAIAAGAIMASCSGDKLSLIHI